MSPQIKCLVFYCVLASVFVSFSSAFLWFPRYSVLQITMSMVMPFKHPVYKLNMNVGFQVNYNLPWNDTEFTKPLHWAQKRDLHGSMAVNDSRYKQDLSAGEFYTAIEGLFEERGFHNSCMLKTVCEMAQHPLEHDEDENIMAGLLHLIFTPSLHDAFEDHEAVTQDNYLRAEHLGRQGLCEESFKNCPESLADHFSYLDHEE